MQEASTGPSSPSPQKESFLKDSIEEIEEARKKRLPAHELFPFLAGSPPKQGTDLISMWEKEVIFYNFSSI